MLLLCVVCLVADVFSAVEMIYPLSKVREEAVTARVPLQESDVSRCNAL